MNELVSTLDLKTVREKSKWKIMNNSEKLVLKIED
jgi:hypothetical protein